MEYEIWSSENSLILSFFPEFISKMKMMKVQFNMVEFYIIVTEVELCVLNYFCRGGVNVIVHCYKICRTFAVR